MSDKIVPIRMRPGQTNPTTEQTGEGTAFCLNCKGFEWQAEGPTGVLDLECPQCHRMTGKWKWEFVLDTDELVQECNCGNRLFYLSPIGHLCANCGLYQHY